jgi:eukaryotic-like serine/threonine-protein kinase
MGSQRSPADSPPVLEPGARVASGYDVREHLSRGRALDVYEVWSHERDCLCVVKTLRPDRVADRAAHRRLRLEGTLLLQLTHPHIVRAYELLSRPEPAVVLETIGGATLAYLIQARSRRFPANEVALLGLQLASAVGYIHRHGYLHMDVKPSNIVCDAGIAKLIDLSVVRRPGNGRKVTGTRVYMAPEQARPGRLTSATDVWGLGGVLYEAATGRRPFEGADSNGVPQLEHRADSVRTRRRLPRELGTAIDACLEPCADDRPTLPELSALLAQFA